MVYRAALLALLGIAVLPPPAAEAAALQPHRAAYDLTLRSARESSGIQQLSGRLVIEVVGACDGYVFNQRILTEMTHTDGQNVVNDFNISSWENMEGTAFSFSLRNEVNGQVVENVDGRAELQGPGKSGEAVFGAPAETVLPLPAGTMFPMQHTLRLLEVAGARPTYSALVFDGSGPDGLYHTFAVVSAAERRPAPGESFADVVAGEKAWPMRLAYFPYAPDEPASAETPDFEVGFTLYGNGLASDLILDYGGFALDGRLREVVPLPAPRC